MLAINCTSTNPYFNLAMEDYLFHHLPDDERVILLWQNSPCVVVGKFQNAFGEVNMPFLRERGIPVARRISGGGAVYHDLGNLNYSFFTPNPGHHAIDYHPFTAPILRALASLGVSGEHNARNDLIIGDLKISGNAQHITRKRILHHGTLLFNADLDALVQSLQPPAGQITSKATQSVRSRVTNIADHLPDSVSLDVFKQAIYAQLDSSDSPLFFRDLQSEEVAAIDRLVREKYGCWEWNFGKSPRFTRGLTEKICGCDVTVSVEVNKGIIAEVKLSGEFPESQRAVEIARRLVGRQCRERELAAVLSEVVWDSAELKAAVEDLYSHVFGLRVCKDGAGG